MGMRDVLAERDAPCAKEEAIGLRRLPSRRGDPPRLPQRGHVSKYRRGASKSTTYFFYEDITYGNAACG
jgi:hypothetical protein